MLMNLLTNSSLPEGYQEVTIGTAALYALIGFLVVFAGISFLIFVVWLVGKVMSKANETAVVKEKPAPKKVEPVPAQTVVEEDVDEETVVLIMAALMAYYEKNNPQCEFTLKRIKRIRRNDNA